LLVGVFLSNTNAQPTGAFLKNKNYYVNTFTSTEILNLDNAYAIQQKSTKYFLKSKEFHDKAVKFKKMQNLPISASKIKKYKKKETKYLTKAAKSKIKGLEYCFEANQTIKNVYMDNLNSSTFSGEKDLMKELTGIQNAYSDSAVLFQAMTSNAPDIDKATYWSNRYYSENHALLFMEYKFAVINGDKEITDALKKKYLNEKTDNDNNKVVYDEKNNGNNNEKNV